MSMRDWLQEAIKRKASDLHLSAGHPPIFRVHGELVAGKDKTLTAKAVETAVKEIMEEVRWKRFQQEKELDFAHEDLDYRFRINLHLDRGQVALSARLIRKTIPTFEEIDMPESIQALAEEKNGLVIFTGPAGVGKSTSLAAILGAINATKPYHIVTLEDPIEFVFPPGKGLVKQREVGMDTRSFPEGLRRALRQDPDVIMVGEMRDAETIATALTLAETGHLVFSTLHTSIAAQAVHRIVDSFNGSEQEQVRHQLSLSLRAVVAQQLLPRAGGGLVAARELLLNTSAIANLIRENKVEQIPSVVQTSRAEGMTSMSRAIQELLDKRLITKETAEAYLPAQERSRRR